MKSPDDSFEGEALWESKSMERSVAAVLAPDEDHIDEVRLESENGEESPEENETVERERASMVDNIQW